MSTRNNTEFNPVEIIKDTKLNIAEVIHQTEDYSLRVLL